MRKIISGVLLCILILTCCACEKNNAQEEMVFDNAPQMEDHYDVIVIGGEPEGVAAAVSAARNGMKTLLVEDDNALGGLMTIGELNFIDMCEGRDGTLLTQGIFQEFYDAVGGSAFDIIQAKNTFLQMVMQQENITLRLQTKFAAPVMEGNCIKGVVLQEGTKQMTCYAPCMIDATVDADVAAASGVPYTFAGEDIGEANRQMGVTLVFELSDVNWGKVYRHLNWQRFSAQYLTKSAADMGATKKMAWGYTEEGYGYQPQDQGMRLRGFNIARQDNGNVLINALIIFGVDVLDDASKAQAIERGKAELAYILPYVREHFAGFEQAQLVSTAEQLYVRESRHIVGENQLTIDDVLENRDQWDKIAIGSYPVDVQPTAEQTYGTVIGSPDRYAISFGCLVPQRVDGLLVVGRSASYSSLAAGSARVIPLGMACGEAAGVACAYAVNEDMDFRSICNNKAAIASIQETLRAQGAYLEDFSISEPVMAHWAYGGVKILRRLGLLDGGYSNDYHLDEPMGRWRYQNMINGVLKKAGIATDYIEVNDNPPNRQIIGTCARAAAAQIGVKNIDDYETYRRWLLKQGILTEELMPYFDDKEANPNAAEVVMLCANLYQWLDALQK